MKVAYHELYSIVLSEPHRFPMEKYDLIYRALLYEGIISEQDVLRGEPVLTKDLYRIHTPEYVNRFLSGQLSRKEQRKTGFMHSKELVERELIILSGTRKCAYSALEEGVAFNIAGGTHHAYSDRGEGFCMLNDQAFAASDLIHTKAVSKVLILDLDVHQGNGTAEIFSDDPNVFTFSMHGKNNYPLHKEKSDRDVVLEDGIEDDQYLSILNRELINLKEVGADIIFYQCGVDVLGTDKLGKLGLTKKGCQERDDAVFKFAQENGLPVVCTMGGGYSERLSDIVDAHLNTFKSAQRFLE